MDSASSAVAERAADEAPLHARNLAAFEIALARAGGWPYEEGDGWVAADAAVDSLFFSFCVLTRDGAGPRPTVYEGRPGPVGWLVMDMWGRPADGDPPAPVLMRRHPAPLPASADPRVLVARTPQELRLVERALAVGLEQPALRRDPLLGDDLLDGRTACVAGLVDGEPVACAVAHDDGTSIGVYLVGTAIPHRGRGLGAATTAAALAALPLRPALLTATTVGRPVYERLGFTAVGRATMLLRERDAVPQPR